MISKMSGRRKSEGELFVSLLHNIPSKLHSLSIHHTSSTGYVDRILNDDDENKDGYIGYREFVQATRLNKLLKRL